MAGNPTWITTMGCTVSFVSVGTSWTSGTSARVPAKLSGNLNLEPKKDPGRSNG